MLPPPNSVHRAAAQAWSRPYRCNSCGWVGPQSALIWSRPRGFLCPECRQKSVVRVEVIKLEEVSYAESVLR